MDFGEKIYSLRTKRKMSQNELADLLEVSRQSVSKWENNSAVPELEKIVQMCEIFGVTVDELVRGEIKSGETEKKTVSGNVNCTKCKNDIKEPKTNCRIVYKYVGIMLLIAALIVVVITSVLGNMAVGLMLAVPFVICAAICLIVKRNAGLCCGWAIAILADTVVYFAMAIRRIDVIYTMGWTYDMNYFRLFIAWGDLIASLALSIATAIILKKQLYFQNEPEYLKIKLKRLKIIGLACIVVIMLIYILSYIMSMPIQYTVVGFVTDWAIMAVVAIGIICIKKEHKSK